MAGRGLADGFRERAPAPYPLGALAPLAQQPTAVRAPAHRKRWTNRRPGSGATRKPRHHTQRRKVAEFLHVALAALGLPSLTRPALNSEFPLLLPPECWEYPAGQQFGLVLVTLACHLHT